MSPPVAHSTETDGMGPRTLEPNDVGAMRVETARLEESPEILPVVQSPFVTHMPMERPRSSDSAEDLSTAAIASRHRLASS